MFCADKAVLLRKYQDNVHTYVQLVKKLGALTRSVPRLEWELVWKLTVEARRRCHIARRFMDSHVAHHHCGVT